MLQRRGMLVAGRPVDRPGVGQALAGGQDLLDQQPAISADRRPEPGEVGQRVGEAVDVVDAHAGERRMAGEQAGHGVDRRGDLGMLDPHGDQVVDREEAAHVARRLRPVLEVVVLPRQQLVHRQGLGPMGQRPPAVAEVQLPALAAASRSTSSGSPSTGRITLPPAASQSTSNQRRRGAVGTVAQHRPPRGVELGPADGDVVGDVVDECSHPTLRECVEQRRQAVDPAELGAHPGVVDDVVAVGAAGHGLGDRREVDVADPERRQPLELGGGGVERERRRQLEAVRRPRNRREHRHALPISRSGGGVRRGGSGSSGGGGRR